MALLDSIADSLGLFVFGSLVLCFFRGFCWIFALLQEKISDSAFFFYCCVSVCPRVNLLIVFIHADPNH